jgi:adenylate cyclase
MDAPMPEGLPSSTDAAASTAVGRQRYLAAIAFADVVGYSALMAHDDAGTHARWESLLTRVIRPEATRHRGTIVQVMGDGVLAEFPSALDALEWGRGVHRGVREAQSEPAGERPGSPEPPPIVLRIAIHIGDVVATGGGIFGDGVNLAARLQEHADPGGIVLSDTAHDLLRGTGELGLRCLGQLRLRNIDRPVRAYALAPEALGAAAGAVRPPTVGALPSIAVLPLENLGGDPADDYFADGVVEDIVVSLSGLRELMVIARASTLSYRGRQPDPREVGRALGVHYVLSGSVRRSSTRLRIVTQLSDAGTGATLWADRTETAPDALFDVQDEIVARVVAGIAPQVRAVELQRALRKRPESLSAYDCLLHGLGQMHSLERGAFLKARDSLERAMAEDPGYAMPVACAARWHVLQVGQGWSADPRTDAQRAATLAARAIGLDPQNSLALAIHGHQKSFLSHDYDSAVIYHNRALLAGPSNAVAWLFSSCTQSYIGRAAAAVTQAQHALRLSPSDPDLRLFYNVLGLAHFANGDYEEAARWTRMSAGENPAFTANLRFMIAAVAGLGRLDEAREAAARLMRLEPDFRLAEYLRTRMPFRDPAIRERYMSHLRAAGLPE